MEKYFALSELKRRAVPIVDVGQSTGTVGVPLRVLDEIPEAKVRENKACHNASEEFDAADRFLCSECGIELGDWNRIERDEDDGEETHFEYRFRFCPNCGSPITEA